MLEVTLWLIWKIALGGKQKERTKKPGVKKTGIRFEHIPVLGQEKTLKRSEKNGSVIGGSGQ